MPRYETLVSSHGALAARVLPRFLYVSRGGQVAVSNFSSLFLLFFCGFACSPEPELGGLGAVLLRLRQTNCETRASTVTIFSREGSAVRIDNAARNGEPHSSPFRFCGKEWLEKLLDHSAGKTRTRIAHPDENVSVSITARMNGNASRIGGHSSHCFK